MDLSFRETEQMSDNLKGCICSLQLYLNTKKIEYVIKSLISKTF